MTTRANNDDEPRRATLDRFTVLTSGTPADQPGLRTVTTADHARIREWSEQHGAQPATGEATRSGTGVRDVNDTGAGIRFNFPGFSPFRPIDWDEWFDNFERHELLFVFEEETGSQAAGTPAADGAEPATRRGHSPADRGAPVRYRLIKRPVPAAPAL